MENYIDILMGYVYSYGPKLILAILTLWIGFKVIRKMTILLELAIERKEVDLSLRKFLSSLFNILMKTLLILSVISIVGVDTTSFVAILASAGFAIGMALQGSLGNFAGGVLILFFKPFKVGDVIEAQGFIGAVNSIQVFNTVLKTPDNKTIIIPNGPLAGGPITNYTLEKTRRVDFTFGIGYGDDIKKARDVIKSIIEADERILKDPTYMIAVGALADSSVNLTVRVWTKTEDYWDVFFDMTESVKVKFDENSISIPFPQTDIHIHNTK